MYELKKLPSGFWSIWIDGTWIDASCKTEKEARAKAEKLSPLSAIVTK